MDEKTDRAGMAVLGALRAASLTAGALGQHGVLAHVSHLATLAAERLDRVVAGPHGAAGLDSASATGRTFPVRLAEDYVEAVNGFGVTTR